MTKAAIVMVDLTIFREGENTAVNNALASTYSFIRDRKSTKVCFPDLHSSNDALSSTNRRGLNGVVVFAIVLGKLEVLPIDNCPPTGEGTQQCDKAANRDDASHSDSAEMVCKGAYQCHYNEGENHADPQE